MRRSPLILCALCLFLSACKKEPSEQEKVEKKIKARLKMDAMSAYRAHDKEVLISTFTITDSVLEGASGGRVTATIMFKVKSSAIVFANTHTHRMKLIYDSSGSFERAEDIEDIEDVGISIGP